MRRKKGLWIIFPVWVAHQDPAHQDGWNPDFYHTQVSV
jgi:hypothetical protein